MDVKTIFRNLVTNQYMENYDYSDHLSRFSFQTVFYRTAHTYCCCSCAFEFEFLEFISDTGEVDEELYEKIVKSIIDGKCPHADKVGKEQLKETSICGLNIAAGVGTEEAVKETLQHNHTITEGLFQMSHYHSAIIKNKYNIAVLISDTFFLSPYEPNNLIPYASRSEDKIHIKVAQYFPLELCVHTRDNRSLKTFLQPLNEIAGLPKALEFTMKHHLLDMQEDLLEYIKDISLYHYINNTRSSPYFLHSIINCLKLAIMYNKPNILDRLLNYLPSQVLTDVSDSDLCVALGREECKQVFIKHRCFNQRRLSLNKEISTLLHVLENFYDDFKMEIMEDLKQVTANNQEKSRNYLNAFLHEHSNMEKTAIVKVALQLGADVDSVVNFGKTPLICLLKGNRHNDVITKGVRETLEAFINENPDVELNKAAVGLAIETDARKRRENHYGVPIFDDYKTDLKEYGLYGYKMEDDDSALNFLAPLLMECGFPVTQNVLLDSTNKPLHQSEHMYIQKYLDGPRPLKVRCRDVLRNHFKGRKIHKFVEMSDYPHTIKDFILLKPILHTLFK